MKYIYSITEENVDGCGGNATEFISSTTPLTQAEQQTLKDCLDTVKQNAADNNEDADTGTMVADAMSKFQEKTGKILEAANDAIQGYLTF